MSIGPETNPGSAIDCDAATFRKLKRAVLMGGSVPGRAESVHRGRSLVRYASIPRRSNSRSLSEPKSSKPEHLWRMRCSCFTHCGRTALFKLLHCSTPSFVGYATHPELCSTQPMRLRVDEGYTPVESGAPKTQVCLRSSSDQFLEFFMPRILAPPKVGNALVAKAKRMACLTQVLKVVCRGDLGDNSVCALSGTMAICSLSHLTVCVWFE
jgi:purine nucleosidase